MPKALKYATNSVVYFRGDRTDCFYVLKSGKICVSTEDVVTTSVDTTPSSKQQIVVPGGFFGAQAFLAQVPQEETAVCLLPSEVVSFSLEEFNKMAQANNDLVFRILRVFSLEMSEAHRRVEELLSQKGVLEQISPEDGLFNVGTYFFKNRYYRQAIMAMDHYIDQYPSGKYVDICETRMGEAESKLDSNYDNSNKMSFKSNADQVICNVVSEAEKVFKEAQSLFHQKKYAPCILKFSRIVREQDNPEFEPYIPDSMYSSGLAFVHLNKIEEAVEQFTALMQRYPKYSKFAEAMLQLATCYEKQGDKVRSKVLYEKLLVILPADSPLRRHIKEENLKE